jgi:hypothetical protein
MKKSGRMTMGFRNFVKGSGKKLFGGGDEPTLDGAALQDEISELGLDASGMEITVDGDTVKVSGDAVSQEMKEKSSWPSATSKASLLLKTAYQALASQYFTQWKKATRFGPRRPV